MYLATVIYNYFIQNNVRNSLIIQNLLEYGTFDASY